MTSPNESPTSEPAAAAAEPVADSAPYPVIPMAPDAMLTQVIERAEQPSLTKIEEVRNVVD